MSLFDLMLPPVETVSPVQLATREVYIKGDDWHSRDEYRSILETEWRQLIAGATGVSDTSLNDVFKVVIPAYACIQYRAQLITEVAIRVVDENGEAIEPHPFGHFLRTAPQLLEDVERAQLIWGQAYAEKMPNAAGFPSGLKWRNNNHVENVIDHMGHITGYWLMTPQHRRVGLDEVVYFSLFDVSGLGDPLSPLEVAFSEANIDLNIAKYAATFFFNSARPDGMLSFTEETSDAQLQDARETWRKAFKGSSNAHRTAVMPPGAKWTPIQMSMGDLALAELNDQTTQRICAAFRIHPVLVGLGNAPDALSAQSTLESEQRQAVDRVIIPSAKRILRALTDQWASVDFVPNGHYTLAVNRAAIDLLSDVNKDKADTANSLSESGVYDTDESRELMGLLPRGDDVLWPARNSTQPRNLWNDGLATLNQARLMIGFDKIDAGDFLKLGADYVPLSKLGDYVDPPKPEPKSEDETIIVSEQPALAPVVENPLVVPAGEGDEDEAISVQELPVRFDLRANSTGEASAYILFDLSYEPLLMAIQSLVRNLMVDEVKVVRWVDPHDLHLTLTHCPIMDTEQARAVMAMLPAMIEPFALQIGALSVFDNETLVIKLDVEADQRLRDFQRSIHDLCVQAGATVSDTSDPDNWRPHVTLAYAQKGASVPEFNQPVTVKGQGLAISRPDHYEIGGLWLGGQDEPQLDLEDGAFTEQPSEMSAKRAGMPLSLGVDLANNQFVRYARRNLSRLLSDRPDVVWLGDSEWRIDFLRIEDWHPGDVAQLMRNLDISKASKINAWTDGYVIQGESVYLKITESDLTRRFAESIRLEAEGYNIKGDGVPPFGVLLCRANPPISDEDLNADTSQKYPLVLTNVSLAIGKKSQTTWPLRGVSSEAVKELRNWRLVTERKGNDAFKPDVLAGSAVADFIIWALSTEAPIESVFGYADSMLRGEVELVAFEDGKPIATESILPMLQAISTFDGGDEIRTKATYKRAIRNLFRGFWANEFDMFQFIDAGQSAISRNYRNAWVEGARREGVSEHELTPAELAELATEINNEIRNLLKVATDLEGMTKADGGKLKSVLSRADGWIARYDRIRTKGQLAAAGDKKKIWRVGNTEHCPDCKKLNGRVYRASKWRESGIEPQSPDLNCFGIHCKCKLENTDEPITRGRFPKIIGPRHDVADEMHYHVEESDDDSYTDE